MGLGKLGKSKAKKAKRTKAVKGATPAKFVTYHARGGGNKNAIVIPDELNELTGTERNLVVFSVRSGTPSLRNAVKEGTGPGTYSA